MMILMCHLPGFLFLSLFPFALGLFDLQLPISFCLLHLSLPYGCILALAGVKGEEHCICVCIYLH